MVEIRGKSRAGQPQPAVQSVRRPGKARAMRVSLIVAAVLFACGFGYAAGSWKLFAPDGSIALEYRSFMPGDEPNIEVDTAALRNRLAEGEAAVFYLKAQNRYIGLANEREYTDYSQFAAEVGRRAPLNEAGYGFVFQSGSLVHDLKWGVADDTAWPDPKTAEELSYRTIPLGDTVGYTASYENGRGSQVSLTVWFNVPDRAIYTTAMNEADVEKVKIGSTEAFYLKERDSDAQRVAWGEGGGERYAYYSLEDLSADKLPRERLVEIASMLGGK